MSYQRLIPLVTLGLCLNASFVLSSQVELFTFSMQGVVLTYH